MQGEKPQMEEYVGLKISHNMLDPVMALVERALQIFMLHIADGYQITIAYYMRLF
jgi:hypothetical protein